MTQEEIYKKIEDIYASEKGKKFIVHLIRSFFPMDRTYYMFDPITGAKCCITDTPLVSKLEVLHIMNVNQDLLMQQIQFNVKKAFGEIKEDQIIENPIRKALGEKVLGVQCDGSTKLMCVEALEALKNFLINKTLSGDKHVSWVLKDEQRKNFIKNRPETTNEEQKAIKKMVSTPAKISLGDFEVLKNLKEKLTKEENGNS